MNYFILVLLLVGIQCEDTTLGVCVNTHIRKEKENIISNIRNKIPQNNNMKISIIYYDVLLCVTGSHMSNHIIQMNFYRYIYRIIFKNESDLTLIHKAYCNSGNESGIKKCFSLLGDDYPCSQLTDSFGACSNDLNFDDGL